MTVQYNEPCLFSMRWSVWGPVTAENVPYPCVIALCGLILAAGLLFSRRSVSAVTLHRGGDRVTIVTAGLFGFGSSFTVPLRHISSMAHRSEVPAMIPLKIKGKPLYFLLDKQGQVSNAKLFDITVGAYRKL
ncbi:transmembrane protein 223 isoform X2 [Spea bombifrons]|uniref:transmembrane protein 223 isoform X2 n=1 Tax=Spea bombifrons TaxID=233779 RepID=UPI00234AB633|nr:transmembrane protein 223 isoform X2 [Spea bombifrons]